MRVHGDDGAKPALLFSPARFHNFDGYAKPPVDDFVHTAYIFAFK